MAGGAQPTFPRKNERDECRGQPRNDVVISERHAIVTLPLFSTLVSIMATAATWGKRKAPG